MPYESKVPLDDYVRVIAKHWSGEVMARRKDPHSHPPTKPISTQRVETDHINRQLQARLAGGHENPVRVSSGGKDEWPTDCPVRIDVLRVLGRFEHDLAGPAIGLMGHIIDMDFYVAKARVEIKLYRDPLAIKISVNGDEIWRQIEDPDSRPSSPSSIRAAINDIDGSWVDQVKLQPGDEVTEGPLGVPVITRAADTEAGDDGEDDVEWE